MARQRTAGHHLVAIYSTMRPAREAVTHLDRAGIEAADISVVPQEPEDVDDTSLRDARVVGSVSKRVVRWSAFGGVVGGLLGLALGLFFLQGVGVWVAIVAGATAGSLFGGFLGGMAGLSMSDDWELTFESLRKGEVAVVVASEDPEEIEKAAKTIEETSPLRVERLGSGGKPPTK